MTGVAGRVVIVAGASGGAGSATALALHTAGANVVAVGRSLERLHPLGAAGLDLEVADLTDRGQTDDLAARVLERHGAIDGVVHLVGGYRGGDGFTANTDADWAFLSANLIDSLRHLTLAVYDDLAASPAGRAVIVSAKAVDSPSAGSANYATAKAAAETWMRALADGLRRGRTGQFHQPGQQVSAATILVVTALVDDAMRAAAPERAFRGFTDVKDLTARIVGLWDADAAEINGARILL